MEESCKDGSFIFEFTSLSIYIISMQEVCHNRMFNSLSKSSATMAEKNEGVESSPGKICTVCLEEGSGVYFGAMVCLPCKVRCAYILWYRLN